MGEGAVEAVVMGKDGVVREVEEGVVLSLLSCHAPVPPPHLCWVPAPRAGAAAVPAQSVGERCTATCSSHHHVRATPPRETP